MRNNVTFSNLTEEQINAIKVLLGDACDIEEKEIDEAEFPKYGSIYYFIDSDGEVCQSFWEDDGIDRDCLSLGNCFETREEAEFEVERLKVLHEMKQFAEPKDYKWDNNNNHYYIYYSFLDNTIRTGNCYCSKSNHIYFKSEEDVKICFESIGEDRIKNYYLQVKKTDTSIKETKNVQLLS